MSMLTIRNLDDSLKTKLRISAAKHGCSMEEEVRRILGLALQPKKGRKGFGSRLHRRFILKTGGVELDIPARSKSRPVPDFGAPSVSP